MTGSSSSDNYKKLLENYDAYYVPGINKRWLRLKDIEPLVKSLSEKNEFEVRTAGKSVLGKNIYRIKWGNGPVNILMWSQMHGDESTHTRALFDFYGFLGASDEFNFLRQKLDGSVTIYTLPMLNPDGAELYSRRNVLGIDINRDALRLESPESRILKDLLDNIRPEFGFNLHDQSRYYKVGDSIKPATVSFLVPAYNEEKTINEKRQKTMGMVSVLNDMLQEFIPGQVARYDDTFNIRAFGDNIQKWGTGAVLFEAGEAPGDNDREFVRKLMFLCMTESVRLISEGILDSFAHENYFKIPENDENMVDLLIKNVRVGNAREEYVIDIAINRNDEFDIKQQTIVEKPVIEDIGDLSIYGAHEVRDLQGFSVKEELSALKIGANPRLTFLKESEPVYLLENGFLTVCKSY